MVASGPGTRGLSCLRVVWTEDFTDRLLTEGLFEFISIDLVFILDDLEVKKLRFTKKS